MTIGCLGVLCKVLLLNFLYQMCRLSIHLHKHVSLQATHVGLKYIVLVSYTLLLPQFVSGPNLHFEIQASMHYDCCCLCRHAGIKILIDALLLRV